MWPLLTDRIASVALFAILAAVASTVLLARGILGERLSRWQIAGVVTALVAVMLIVGG